jgi:hypothetical protein
MGVARKPQNNITQILMWLSIRELGQFKLSQLQRRAKCHYETATRYLKALQEQGYVTEVGQADPRKGRDTRGRSQSLYQLTRDTGPKAPRHYVATGQVIDPNLPGCPVIDPLDRTWQAMRIQSRRFTAVKVEELADIDHRKCLKYLRKFIRCGYVKVISLPGERPPEYRLVRNSGPLCPVFFGDGRAFDLNERAEYQPDQPLA